MTIYDKIKSLCLEQKTTITKVESLCGLSQNSIKKWDKSSPKVDSLIKVADCLNVSIAYFFEEEIKKALPQINEVTLSQEEQELINLILSLTDEEVQELSSFVDYIISKRNK